MKTVLPLCIVAGLISMITSCAIPPREAMRIVQRDGLISYLSHDYSHCTHAAPLRVSPTPYTTPRPVALVPYRSTYHTNRYAKADYNRVPYRPKSSSTRSKSSSSKAKKRVATSEPSSPRSSTTSTASVSDRPKTSTSSPSSSAAQAPAKKPAEALPYGSPVSGRPGMVTSPFAQKQQLVDVTGMAPGDTVKDPYSGKLFRVPPTQQVSAATTPKTAPAPEPADEKEKPASKTPSPTPAPLTEAKPTTPETPKP